MRIFSLIKNFFSSNKSERVVFPGQIWNVPHVGEVYVINVTEKCVDYIIVNGKEDGCFACIREEFLKFCSLTNEEGVKLKEDVEEAEEQNSQVVQFKSKKDSQEKE